MKTTNFFIDYLVIGVILFAGLFYPMQTINPKCLEFIANYSMKDKPYILPLITVFVYISGIMFNQISDVFLSKTRKLFGLGKIYKEEMKLDKIVEGGYHAALQRVIFTSQSAYSFLSFRRSTIRIFRALFVVLLMLIVYFILIIVLNALNISLNGQHNNSLLIIFLALLSFVRYRMIKLQIGYYKAIENFYTNSVEINCLDFNNIKNNQ